MISSCIFWRLLAPQMLHLGSLCRSKNNKKSDSSPKGLFGASPGIICCHFGTVCHVFGIVFCCIPTSSEQSGWGKGSGKAPFSKPHFSVPKPFQHHNLWLARWGFALQLGYINYIDIYIYIYIYYISINYILAWNCRSNRQISMRNRTLRDQDSLSWLVTWSSNMVK